ncbi:MAG: TIGR04282 family arsenosugar biosynthesis glycosyltransferase, partial [Dermatophilaceae bacterium]
MTAHEARAGRASADARSGQEVMDGGARESFPRPATARHGAESDVIGSVLVVAKPPRPGEAKTRLAAAVDPAAAADLAAAALLDTLDVAAAVFPVGRRVLALAGDLAGACRESALRSAVSGWAVVDQRGSTFGERLADAHAQAHRMTRGPVAQIGMDTPHVDPGLVGSLPARARRSGRPVLGLAEDGGWWVLVTCDPHQAEALADVPMSRPDTGRLTVAALTAAGSPPELTVTLRDVDVPDDAHAVAALAPQTRFARAWRQAR